MIDYQQKPKKGRRATKCYCGATTSHGTIEVELQGSIEGGSNSKLPAEPSVNEQGGTGDKNNATKKGSTSSKSLGTATVADESQMAAYRSS